MSKPRIAQAWLLAMALLSSVLAFGAATAYTILCDSASGVLPKPNEYKRVGYVTLFQGMGSSFRPDLRVASPYKGYPTIAGAPPSTGNTVQVVGVIEKFEWNGGTNDPIKITFYVSQANATQMKALTQLALKSTKVDQLGWWIADYDPEAKKWYEKAYPQGTPAVSGLVTGKENPDLNVDLTPVPLNNATLYRVILSVAPAASMQYALSFATSATTRVSKPWGLTVGTLYRTPVGK